MSDHRPAAPTPRPPTIHDRLFGEGAVRVWTVIGGAATALAVLIPVLAFMFGGAGAPHNDPASTATRGSVPSVTSSPQSVESPTPSARAAEANEIEVYLDEYVGPCGVAGSIDGIGSTNINGVPYAHTLRQTANGYDETNFYLARQARRFQATVGPTDTAQPGHRMRFQLRAETGQTLFESDVLGPGQTQAVDVPVDGVLKLFVIAKTVGEAHGGQGSAGWGDARVTATAPLSCP